MTEKTAANPEQLQYAARLADLYVEVEKEGLLTGWIDYIKGKARAIGMPWERMEKAIARRKSLSEQQQPGE